MTKDGNMTWAEICFGIAQGTINVTEGLTNVEPGSLVHRAMEQFCTRFTNVENGSEGLPPQWELAAAHLAGYEKY